VTENRTPYPVRVNAAEEVSVSRGLWLVKWLLLIPHYVVLAFLWLAFFVVTVIAFFAILVTARYPRSLFNFNVGVLRWTWRVHYYGYWALATDRYPPFTLADVPDYPAHLEVAYPERLSRGLVLVKSWLLAIPHLLIVSIFIGGGLYISSQASSGTGVSNPWVAVVDLVSLLLCICAIALLFTGRYPRQLYDFIVGMDRWAVRVAAYVALMTDRYPPFRLDQGPIDPESVPARPTPPTGTPDAGAYTPPPPPTTGAYTPPSPRSAPAGSSAPPRSTAGTGAGGHAEP